ncbi:MAG: hypothetical protein ABI642_02255 [Polaromonas sp.]
MSTLDAKRLYALLPAVYRIRDEQQGHPLRALVALIAQEFEALEENIEQLYDDQFIETCADWVAPYIGDLIGYRPLHGVAPAIASPRAEVAHTIAYRRRKGTASMLEQLARDVTDWPARAVEFFEQLATTQYMNHVRLHAPASADLRSLPRMQQQGGPFNRVAHTAEMRRPETGSGRYNIPNIGIFLWRLQPFRLSDVPLTPDPGDSSGRRFRFNPLGADQPLFRLPATEKQITHIAEPANVPALLHIRELALQMHTAQDTSEVVVQTQDYGNSRSFVLRRSGAVVPVNRSGPAAPPGDPPSRAIAELRIADLRDIVDSGGTAVGWAHEAATLPDDILIDPERGRVLLGSTRAAEYVVEPFVASFHHGFSLPIGGGEYERSPQGGQLARQRSASGGDGLQTQLDAIASEGRLMLGDSLTYAQTPVFKVDAELDPTAPGKTVVVAARNGARPLIASGAPVTLAIGARGRLVIDGLVISGGALELAAAADDQPRELVLRDCTLVPGVSLNTDGSAASPGAVSLLISHPFAQVTLERCITGPLQAVAGAQVFMHDCIVDAGSASNAAFDADGAGGVGAELTVTESTVIGKVHTRLMRLASNSIFFAALGALPLESWHAPLMAERRQEGCMRFCYLPAGAITPRPFRCVTGGLSVLPHFTSLRYGDPGYGQLRPATAKEIREGAEDGGEIGVMHALFQPQRETNLRLRLDEYLRFGLHAGIFYAT